MQVSFDGMPGHLGVLHPGQTAEVPVVIRTSGGGRQDFYMLFRYELWCEQHATSNPIPRRRWTREILSIPVYPSITMSASLMPSYSNKGEHILSIEVRNEMVAIKKTMFALARIFTPLFSLAHELSQ
jgi:hypothetical protein